MNEKDDMILVPYIVHEGIQVRLERTIKRLVTALILTILLLFASNALWLNAWMQYDYVSEESAVTNTVDVDGKNGIATYVGDIINGASRGDINGNNEKASAETEEWSE